ncbi:hypothetical protein BB560_005464 [Smittium megazygosporum]|uniref:PRP1 splicing factor N-terminal domain-containing protein n=1 Tax=Smittium megazygosporum TaxID=133381 RepID=A0A2T9Z517_9FUNG|nr:hypothetical protein BB560_005464 [Smittium megazygosporum]
MKGTKDFLGKPAPPNYIAGLGRGATGFTTRSDIGPARESVLETVQAEQESNFDENQDPENETAFREQKPAIKEQFSDLKRQLASLTQEEWDSIPEATNQSRQKRKRDPRMERYSAVPDSVISGLTDQISQPLSEIQTAGIETPLSSTETVTNFAAIGKARDKVLGIKLDQVEGTMTEIASIDSKGYLTSLNSIAIKSATEVGDIQKARTLLKSVTTTNPKHAPGWIAAARLEEVAGRMAAARQIIKKGCDECPKNEDVWLEASRLNTQENSKIILGQAVRFLPQSVKIWRAAADLEKDTLKKKRVFRRALEFIPSSVALWRALVALEEPYDAKILLSRAVEIIPSSIDLWIALARLETYENAKVVLNKARKAIPTSHEIWISAAQLEESQGTPVDLIISRAFKDSKLVLGLGRERWLAEAEKSEAQGFPQVAQEIINSCLSLGLEDEDEYAKIDIWVSEAEFAVSRGHIQTARAIFAYSLKSVSTDPELWMSAAMLEKNHGTPETLDGLLRRAVEYCPKTESLWLMAAKEKWVWAQDVDSARTILQEAFKFNPNSESIWLAAVKLESSNREFDRARKLLERARDDKSGAGTARVWLKSIVLERQLSNSGEALVLAKSATEHFPKSPKLWMIRGQIESDDMNLFNDARITFSQGLKHNPNSIPLWLLASKLEMNRFNLPVKARAILDRARATNPKSPEIWLETVRIEGNNPTLVKSLLGRAIKECPKSGILWSELILRESRQQRKAKSVDALKNCDNNDPVLITTIARLFWSERKIEKTRSWLERACRVDPLYGDAWAWRLKFETEQSLVNSNKLSNGFSGQPTEINHPANASPGNIDNSTDTQGSQNPELGEYVKKLYLEFKSVSPKYGEVWQRINKDPKNSFLSQEKVLEITAAELPLPMTY